MTEITKRWYTVLEVAVELGKSTQTIRNWIKAGLLEVSQPVPRGRILISASSIEKLLERSTR